MSKHISPGVISCETQQSSMSPIAEVLPLSSWSCSSWLKATSFEGWSSHCSSYRQILPWTLTKCIEVTTFVARIEAWIPHPCHPYPVGILRLRRQHLLEHPGFELRDGKWCQLLLKVFFCWDACNVYSILLLGEDRWFMMRCVLYGYMHVITVMIWKDLQFKIQLWQYMSVSGDDGFPNMLSAIILEQIATSMVRGPTVFERYFLGSMKFTQYMGVWKKSRFGQKWRFFLFATGTISLLPSLMVSTQVHPGCWQVATGAGRLKKQRGQNLMAILWFGRVYSCDIPSSFTEDWPVLNRIFMETCFVESRIWSNSGCLSYLFLYLEYFTSGKVFQTVFERIRKK